MNGATGDWKWGREHVKGMPLTVFFLHNIFSSASPCSQSSSMDSSKSSPILYKPSLKILPIVFLLESEFFKDTLSFSFTQFYISYCLLHRTGQVAGIQKIVTDE